MSPARVGFTFVVALAMIVLLGVMSWGQPNPYRLVENWAQLSPGMVWGQVTRVHPGPEGNIYAFHRCASDTCVDRAEPPILKFDPSGKLLKTWGVGMFVWPHGFHVDRNGFVWATDARAENGRGLQVFKFSPEGKLLLTLGKAGTAGGGPDMFTDPADVVVAPNGDIFVADGHGPGITEIASGRPTSANGRVVKFSKDGKFIKAWGKAGSGPGEFKSLHAIAMDSRGRVFVGDRGNDRLQVFDQEGKFLDEWKQFGSPSGIFISRDDTMYVADNGIVFASASASASAQTGAGQGGIMVGSAKTGSVTAFIPNTSLVYGPEGVGVDARGDVYSAEVGLKTVRKYVKP